MAVEELSPGDALQTFISLKSEKFSKATAARLLELGKAVIRGGDS
jgi:hypothetical protein